MMNVVRMPQSKAKEVRGRHERGVGPEQKEGEPRGTSVQGWDQHLEMPAPLGGSIHYQQQAAMWEPSGYNLKLPDLCLGGPSGSSLISGQHLLWTTSRTLPIGHPVRGKPLYVLCVSNPHPTQKSWIPMSTAPSQECGVLKVMGCWGRKSPQTHFTLDRTEPRCSFPEDSREECEPLLCSPLFHTQPGAQGQLHPHLLAYSLAHYINNFSTNPRQIVPSSSLQNLKSVQRSSVMHFKYSALTESLAARVTLQQCFGS